MKNFLFITFLLLFVSCNSVKKDKYELAIQHITNDPNLLPSVYADYRADSSLIFERDQMLYKVYPEQLNFLFTNFRTEIQKNYPSFSLDSSNLGIGVASEVVIDSSLTFYSNSDTAHIKIFFSELKSNMLSAEVFYRQQNFKYRGFDDYRGNARTNTAAQYLFVFDGSVLDTVYNDEQQYE